MKLLRKTSGSAGSQPMGNFKADRWSAASQLWWTGAKPGDALELELPLEKSGRYDVEFVLTKAQDYGIVQLSLAGEKLGEPIDLYDPEVVTTGVISIEDRELPAGKIKLTLSIVGAHPKAVKSFMVGLDYIRLVPRKQ